MADKKDISQIQERIVREFSVLNDWTEKYEYLIKLGRKLSPMNEDHKSDENLVRGCQSQVWLHAEEDGDRIIFEADSDAMIVKGLAALLMRIYSGQTPDAILSNPPDFIDKIGMENHLSPTRSNGLASMCKQIQYYAMAFKEKHSQEA